MGTKLEILHFATVAEWESWLHKNHDKVPGIWMKFAKKGTGIASIDHDQALLPALCYGWIDGQANKLDETFWIMKFTPRRPKSMWSKRNCNFVTQLIAQGKMQSSGQAQIDAAKADGRWDAAYDSPKNMVVPEDFLKELEKDSKALEFFESLSKTNKYAIVWSLQTAKRPETKVKRIQKFLEMMKKGEKLY